MRQTLKVLLISNVAAVYSFHSFNESITWGSQAITDWNIPLCILPALKAAKIAKFMALLDRRGRIWMIRDINFRVNFLPQFLVFTFFKRHLFCSVFLSIFMDTEVPKVNCDVSIACNIWSVQSKIFASKMRTCDISVLLSVRGVRRVPYKPESDQIILKIS